MRISVAVTVKNEESTIKDLLESLLDQKKKPDEIIIVDGGSQDKTFEIIRHIQKKEKRIRFLKEKCTRARGRNLGVEIAKNEIIAVIDAGCAAKKDWLERITQPLIENEGIDIVAGFYDMVTFSDSQKAFSFFLGVTPKRFGPDFLPSARSMAFRKAAWEKVGGFPEREGNSAEDTDFNTKAIRLGLKFTRVKDARVEWRIPPVKEGLKKIRSYAEWDVRYGTWWQPLHGFSSHNIKACLVLLRYSSGLVLLIFGFKTPFLWLLMAIGLTAYVYWAYRKVFLEFEDEKVALWGVVFQFLTDISVMRGFLTGLLLK